MSRATFLQADIERVIRAARKENAVVQFDLKSLVFTIFPSDRAVPATPAPAHYTADGAENWDD